MTDHSKLLSLSQAHLAARPDCAPFLTTLRGTPTPGAGGALLARGGSDAAREHLPEALAGATRETSPLVRECVERRRDIPWWNAYDESQPTGANYAERTSASLMCGPGGLFEGGDGRAGFFFLRQGVEYAPHAHPPREIYAILSGRALFWSESGWREAGAGDVVHTPENAWHGMTTPFGPILILWSWIGDGLDDQPVFRSDTGRFPEDQPA